MLLKNPVMMPHAKNWHVLSNRVLKGGCVSHDDALSILESSNDDILFILDAAFVLRRRYFGYGVRLHVIQNARRGACSEDCAFCGQSKTASKSVENHPLLSADAILEGARAAYRLKAVRNCIVTSGRQASARDIETICEAARKIKAELPIALCVSLGLLTPEYAARLKEAGIDRYNHNLETSENYFP
ncbi:MAG: radical SAM protein, partial [Kiritimatiellia bacterium]|nr:radical SAM protein [Kiritimatiellia bacterium]